MVGQKKKERRGKKGRKKDRKKERREGEKKRRNRKAINTRDFLTRQLGTLNEIMQLSPQQADRHITNPP